MCKERNTEAEGQCHFHSSLHLEEVGVERIYMLQGQVRMEP